MVHHPQPSAQIPNGWGRFNGTNQSNREKEKGEETKKSFHMETMSHVSWTGCTHCIFHQSIGCCWSVDKGTVLVG